MSKIDLGIFESMARVLQASGQLQELVESFCTNNTRRIIDLKTAVEKQDHTSASAIAHALKGSCSMFGAKSCAELCQRIEQTLGHPSMQTESSEILKMLAALESELSDITTFVREQSNNKKPDCCP